MKESKKEKNKTMIIVILIIIIIVTMGITIWAIFFRNNESVLSPDYAPHEVEKNAEPIELDFEEKKLQQQEGGGAVNLTYSKDVNVDLTSNKVRLMFMNPRKSNQDMIIQIVVKDTVIVQSGLLSPGYKLSQLDLMDNIKLSEGEYEGKFVIMYYQKDSGEKAMINTEIPLVITVKK